MFDITIDLETTVNGGVNGDSPEAHYPNNRVLLYGWTSKVNGPQTSEKGDDLFKLIDHRDA